MAAFPVSDILSSPPLAAASNATLTATRVLLQAATTTTTTTTTGTGGGHSPYKYYRALLGECIVYDDATHSILWVDIDGKSIHELSLVLGMTLLTYGPYAKKVCAIALLSSFAVDVSEAGTGTRNVLVAWEDGFQLCRVLSGSDILVELSEYSEGPKINNENGARLNDGRCDRSGRHFICGGVDFEGATTAVYDVQVQTDGTGTTTLAALTHTEMEQIGLDMPNLRVTNSICFSPDGSKMYFCDSLDQSIVVYDYDSNIESSSSVRLSNRQTLWSAPKEGFVGLPDGSIVDAEGYLWNAVWRGGQAPGYIQRIHPESGQVVTTVTLPDDSTTQTTCCCFGGPDLDVLFITSASEGAASEEPYAGSIYAVKLDVKGLPESKFIWK